jgi:Carbohydrate-binding domain-containing protein Cthe_2159
MGGTRRHHIFTAGILAAALALGGCAATDSTPSADGSDTSSVTTETTPETAVDAATAETETAETETETVAADNQESHFDTADLEYDESEVVAIALDGTTATADSGDVTVDGSTATIGAAGTYSLSGTLSDGQIVVDVPDSDDVILIFDGIDVTNSTGAAVAVLEADSAVVILADGSSNRLTDGADYVFPDADTDEPNATLYSAADLTIAGAGELVVDAAYNDGITSKDGLAIESGTISVVAVDDGIRGKDYVIVDGGTITVDADGDGIKADNDEDAERGYVSITDGVVDLTAGDDGIQAATDVEITGGEVTIDAGSASESGRAIQGDVMVTVSGGVIDATAVDDAIHSNNEVTIEGGTITLASGDDGIHGDLFVTVTGGSITITDSFEGIESEIITIDDGVIDITSNDDGLNVASADAAATTATAEPGRGPGGDPGDAAVGDYYIYINGGTISITIALDLAEQGDGIDANGHVVMTGGIVAVSGPTDTRNSAVDYSGGSFVMTGGLFIGTNVDGRNSEGIGSGSSQASLYITTGSTIPAGTVVHIEDAAGESLVTFEPINDYSVIVFSSPDLVDGETYDVYFGGTVTGDSTTGLYDDSSSTTGDLAGSVTASVSG